MERFQAGSTSTLKRSSASHTTESVEFSSSVTPAALALRALFVWLATTCHVRVTSITAPLLPCHESDCRARSSRAHSPDATHRHLSGTFGQVAINSEYIDSPLHARRPPPVSSHLRGYRFWLVTFLFGNPYSRERATRAERYSPWVALRSPKRILSVLITLTSGFFWGCSAWS